MKPLQLAVAAVVAAALGTVVIGVFLKREGDARRAGSMRNLQQWGIALNLLLMENGNQLPEPGGETVDPGQTRAWFNALPPYISQTPLGEIPPGQRPRPGVPSLWIDPSTKPVRAWDPEVFYFNYAMNAALQPDSRVRSFRIYEVPHPGNVVFLAEVDGFSPSAKPADVAFRHGAARPASPTAAANVLFCDGHVQRFARAQLVDDPETRKAENAETGVSWFIE